MGEQPAQKPGFGFLLRGFRTLGRQQGNHAQAFEVGLQVAAVGIVAAEQSEPVDQGFGNHARVDRHAVAQRIG